MQTETDKRKQSEREKLDEIGRCAYAALAEMVEALQAAEESDDMDAREAAEQTIHEDPLSVQVRSDWHDPGAEGPPEHYMILLATGGPAVRIVGELDRYGEPETATLESQDWFLPWTPYAEADQGVLLAYARCFYFGEG